MKILHYSLGIPPKRTGGMTKYCLDLIEKQKKNNNVYLLFPGKNNYFNNKTVIKQKNYRGIECFEIINSKPIPLCNGIKDFDLFLKNYDEKLFFEFFEKIKIDVVHIHTLMGLDKTFFEECKKRKIKIVFTTHDYFGICPKCSLFMDEICEGNNFDNCECCNSNAFSKKELFLLQSDFYGKIKNSFILRKIRSVLRKKRNIFAEKNKRYISSAFSKDQYYNLQKYYLNMLIMADLIHCNSLVTLNVYSKFVKGNLRYIPISNLSVSDNRKEKKINNKQVRLLFLGPETKVKGFFKLVEVLDELYSEGKKFKLVIHSRDELFSNRPYIDKYPAYVSKDLKKIFDNADVLVFPSIWLETFGFTVLEALSYGVPVILPVNAGSSCLVENDVTGIIYKDSNNLKEALIKVIDRPEIIEKYSENICKSNLKMEMDDLVNTYKELMRE